MAEKKTIYITKDNKQFFDEESANKHENLFDFFEFLKSSVCPHKECDRRECVIKYDMKDGNKIISTNLNYCECSKGEGVLYLETILKNYEYFENYFFLKFKEKENKNYNTIYDKNN